MSKKTSNGRAVAVVVGVGNVGFPLAQLLVLAGIDVVIIDRGTVKNHNLRLQLHRKRDVERPKARVAVKYLRRLRPDVSVTALDCDCRNLGLGFWLSVPDVVFGAVDSLESEGWLGRACLLAGIPFIRPATTGHEGGCGSASVRYFPADGGVCPCCSWGSSTYGTAGIHASCEGRGEGDSFAGAFQTAEDGYLAASLAMKAYRRGTSFAAETQVLGPPDQMEVRVTRLERDESCPWLHARLDRIEPAKRTSLTGLFALAAQRLDAAPERIVLNTSLQPVSKRRWCLKCGRFHLPAFSTFPYGEEECTPPCDGQVDAQRFDNLDLYLGRELLDMAPGPAGMPAGWAGIFKSGGREVLLVTPYRRVHVRNRKENDRTTNDGGIT